MKNIDFVGILRRRGCLNWMNDKMYLSFVFKNQFGYALDLDNPKTFNEKLQWLKLYDRKPEYIQMVDKYEAKKYVANIIGEQYIIPTIGVWDSFDEIDFEKLPNQFVLKCTHDSGGLVICKDKNDFDLEAARAKINQCLKQNYYWQGREWPYKNVKPRIQAEHFIIDPNQQNGLIDYKIHCFNGVPRIISVCKDRLGSSGVTEDFYDTQWNHIDLKRPDINNSTVLLEKPKTLQMMLDFSQTLSYGIPFLRVDLYEVNSKPIFGELAFSPMSGFKRFVPERWDIILGNWIILPKDNIEV